MKNISTIVLAAGKGSRMSLDTPKVLLKLNRKPVLWWCLSLIKELHIKEIQVVLLHNAEKIQNFVKKTEFKVNFVSQETALGTADAVKKALPFVNSKSRDILVLFGDDSGLYSPKTIYNFIKYHRRKKSIMTILTTEEAKARRIGGLKRDQKGNIIGVATQDELLQSSAKKVEVVCGAFCFDRVWLEKNINKVQPSKVSGEYPLPGLIGIAVKQNNFALSYRLKNFNEWNSLNTPEEYKEAKQKKKELMKNVS